MATDGPADRVPRGSPLTLSGKGYYARIGKRPRWICSRKIPHDDALVIYHRKATAIESGVEPLPLRVQSAQTDTNPPLQWLLNKWLVDRRGDAARDELRAASWVQYKLSAKRIDALAGYVLVEDITPDTVRDVYGRLVTRHGIDFAKRAIGHLRTACRHAAEMGWCRPVNLGERMVARLASRPPARMKWRLYTGPEIRRILAAAHRATRSHKGRVADSAIQLRAMIYLALNGGYGATELSELPRSVIDLDHGVIDYRRGKTGADHVVPLWPETIAALRPVMAQRPKDELVFRTREGNPWCRRVAVMKDGKLHRTVSLDNVNERFTALVRPINLKIERSGFYKLKHASATVADAAGDPHATYALFGHELPGAKGHYVKVSLERVREVVGYMRRHLILTRS
jgi:integrase